MMSHDNTKAATTDTRFVIGRVGYEIGTQDANADMLDSGETLREFAIRKLAEQEKSGEPA